MFTCKIKIGANWNLPASIKRQEKARRWLHPKGKTGRDGIL